MALFAQGLLLALIVWQLLRMCETFPHLEGGLPLIYARDTLLSLCYTGTTSPPADLFNLSKHLKSWHLGENYGREADVGGPDSVSAGEAIDLRCPT